MDADKIDAFQVKIWDWYRDNQRDLAWRNDSTPYQVLVSEVMLQQTQVTRVISKYAEWIALFPNLEILGEAPVSEVIRAWQGLGYNRRAIWLQRAAQQVLLDYDGILPDDPAELVKLQGIGPNTAGSICAFAYNKPVYFIETNIRRVYIHEFFENYSEVDDRQLKPIILATIDLDEPRQWYYALMDYGSYLAKVVQNPNRRSKHHAVQSKFEGSARQVRGEILRRLLSGQLSVAELTVFDDRAGELVKTMTQEGFLVIDGTDVRLA